MKRSVFQLILLSTLTFAQSVRADGDHKVFEINDFQLESGTVLPLARISYVTHGSLNASRDNVLLVPSFYGGDHHGYDFLIGEGRALDSSKYFIVATDMFQNGLSSSPSNTPPPFSGPNFPAIAIRDNIEAGYRLLTEEFGVSSIVAVLGFSMGAQQAFQWAVSYPDFMEYSVGWCGSAVEHPHGVMRLEGFKSAIMADAAYNGGNYTEQPLVGLAAGGTHWSAWGTSQEWYRNREFEQLGLSSLEEVNTFFQNLFSNLDANDYIWLANTWQNNNVGDTPGFNGDYAAALRSIKAKVLYMPCETDMYFHIDALRHEAQFIPDVQFTVIPTSWGHFAGGGSSPDDAAFINQTIVDFLE
ncbi:MAG: alpha/beta fold hydrolase [Gammaproteobacteria bacterium]|nr:alpha/beta fold hydrolase [Gammaproteobacteria bacterium]MDD9894221.1 alpha/beta fold hydrolase [Gammaproteobacteria bacterium]MDD9957422.1 alpha/beta fold hydrolase [Gammaproteobacteria bacterium]